MSKKRLSLEKLEIKSFVTDADNENMETIKGGYDYTDRRNLSEYPYCPFTQDSCHFHCEENPFTLPDQTW